MAYWDAQDSRYLLLRRWLNAFREENALTGNEPDKAWRPLDSENNLLAKLLRSYCEAVGLAEDDQNNYRFNDTENDLYRKILNVIHEDDPSLPTGPEHNWRPIDSDRDLLAKILRCTSIQKSNTDPQKDFLPLDSEVWCIRKIVGLLAELDSDAADYIARVEAAGSSVTVNRSAVDQLFRDLKSAGLYDALGTALLLAGPDTLSGALVPLRSDMPAPTNFNFVEGDYSRVLGPLGDASTKYVDLNYADGVPPQNSVSMSGWVSAPRSGSSLQQVFGFGTMASAGASRITTSSVVVGSRVRNTGVSTISLDANALVGFIGVSRDNSSSYDRLVGVGSVEEVVSTSQAPSGLSFAAYNYANSRLGWVHAGLALELSELRGVLTNYVARLV